jgi:predicted helicase
VPFSVAVKRMRLSTDRSAVVVNESLTLDGIPSEVFEYRLGNRSALGWVIEQYQVRTDPHSGSVSDPNLPDDPEYIVKLVERVVALSLDTVKVVAGLPLLELEGTHATEVTTRLS